MVFENIEIGFHWNWNYFLDKDVSGRVTVLGIDLFDFWKRLSLTFFLLKFEFISEYT